MAKGLKRHQARKQAVSLLGKSLVRRSKSTCELCEAHGVALTIFEVPPVPAEPDVEQALFICDDCVSGIENPRRANPDHWRCLGNTIWGELAPAQVMSVRILRGLQKTHHWAEEILEQAFLDPEIEEWSSKG
jgi:protein PhnA